MDPLDPDWGALRGAASVRPDGLVDARVDRASEVPPVPLEAGEARILLDAQAAKVPHREALERLLAALPPGRREHLLQVSKESRGVWSLLLAAREGNALHVGNALSGAVVPLVHLGLRVTLLDLSPERLQLARTFVADQEPWQPGQAANAERVRCVVGGDTPELPFEDASFDVVACDVVGPSEALLAELARVARGEVFVMVDNRLAYKRSSGRTWDFTVPGPLAYARRVLHPRGFERTLWGWRRAATRALGPTHAYALYPDRRDFATVVSFDRPLPRLFVGPNEARNRLKVAAHRLGLFPVLTPSFGLHARRPTAPRAPSRLERVLEAVARETGEPLPTTEHLVGTRGNTCVVMTTVPGADPSEPRGRWLLHMPLHLPHQRGLEVHFRALQHLREHFPAFPVPEPLWMGVADGLWLACERRLPGWASNHVLTGREPADRILEQLADILARLVVRPAQPFGEEDFARVVDPLFDDTLRAIRDGALRAELERRRMQARRLLVGRRFPLVFAHGDVRAKHVQVDDELVVQGFLDLGTVVPEALPGLDLMHRIVHDRKQLEGTHDGETWRELCDPQRLRFGERRALERYAANLGLEPRTLQAVAEVYPVFVSAIIERYAPFVRPDLFRRTFGI